MSSPAVALSVPRARVALAWAAVPAWVAIVLGARLWGLSLEHHYSRLLIGWPPIVGRADWHPGPGLLPAVAIAGAVIGAGPLAATRLGWRALLAVAGVAAAAWTYALAAADGGWANFVAPLQSRYEYLSDVHLVGSPHAFLQGFIHDIGIANPTLYATHVRGHPPGLLLGLWGLSEVGLGGATPLAVAILVAVAATPIAALTVARVRGGEVVARRAAPFVALAPIALWAGTSADALYAGVAATAIAILAVARRDIHALAGGALLGVGLMLSYGLAPLGLVAVAVLWPHRRAIVLTAIGCGAVLLVFAAAGFDWFAGLSATHRIALAGVQSERPYVPFLLISVGAFALALGPAAAVGLARLRDRRLWMVCGAALLAVAFADVSGISRGETERIWLPFAPWLLIAIGGRQLPRNGAQALLCAQAGLALVLQAGVRTPW